MRLRPQFLLALLIPILAACSSGGSSGSPAGDRGGTRDPNAAPCDSVRVLVLSGQLRGVPATLVQALRINLAREVSPSTCDFTNYPGSPGVSAAVERAIASRAQADVDVALRLIGERVAAIQRDPRGCAPRASYPCTTELAWLATQAAKLPGGAGSAAGGSGGGGAVGAAARGAASSFPGEAQAATNAAAGASSPPASSGTSGSGRPTAPVSASDAYTQAAANAQVYGTDPQPWLDKASKAAEAEAAAIAANNSKCTGGRDQLAAIAEAAAKVQMLGGSDSAVNDVLQSAQPIVKSLERQAMAGVDVGLTLPELYVIAQTVGIDVSKSTWMNDPTCTERWTLQVDHEQRIDLGADGGVIIERWVGEIALEVQSNGSATGTGSTTYTGRYTNDVCKWQGEANNVRTTFAPRTPRNGRLTGSVRIENASGNSRVDCTEGISLAGAAGVGSASFIPAVDMPLQRGATVRPPMDDPLGVLAQTGFKITTTYTLR